MVIPDPSKIPIKLITLDAGNLAKFDQLKGGLVLLDTLSQVSVVIQFPDAEKAKKFFKMFDDERGN